MKKTNKKGMLGMEFADVFAILFIIIVMIAGAILMRFNIGNPAEIHIKAGYSSEENKFMENLLKYNSIKGFEGDFAKLVRVSTKNNNFSLVKTVINEHLKDYKNYEFKIYDSEADGNARTRANPYFSAKEGNPINQHRIIVLANYRQKGEPVNKREFDGLIIEWRLE